MPKLWHGMAFGAWLRLLARNRFQVEWSRSHTALIVTLFSIGNSLLRILQGLVYGGRIASTTVEAPIFIIGHYRTGTTLLHELLSRDDRFTFPTTYECFSPNHFLLTEGLVSKYLGFMLPAKRLQDNMHQGWERPQEDESALLNLGAATPYARCAFPNHPDPYPGADDLEGLSPRERNRWMRILLRFMKEVTFLRPRPLVLKSPSHTCRIKYLLQMFPQARFIYTIRDPAEVIPSSLKLWRVVFANQGFQTPTFEGFKDRVFDEFNAMHEAAEQGRRLVPAEQFTQVRYEDLIDDPIAELERVYEQLDLGKLGNATEAMQRYLGNNRDYRKNQHVLNDAERNEIAQRTNAYRTVHGYDA